jgi:hypothetical protein
MQGQKLTCAHVCILGYGCFISYVWDFNFTVVQLFKIKNLHQRHILLPNGRGKTKNKKMQSTPQHGLGSALRNSQVKKPRLQSFSWFF